LYIPLTPGGLPVCRILWDAKRDGQAGFRRRNSATRLPANPSNKPGALTEFSARFFSGNGVKQNV